MVATAWTAFAGAAGAAFAGAGVEARRIVGTFGAAGGVFAAVVPAGFGVAGTAFTAVGTAGFGAAGTACAVDVADGFGAAGTACAVDVADGFGGAGAACAAVGTAGFGAPATGFAGGAYGFGVADLAVEFCFAAVACFKAAASAACFSAAVSFRTAAFFWASVCFEADGFGAEAGVGAGCVDEVACAPNNGVAITTNTTAVANSFRFIAASTRESVEGARARGVPRTARRDLALTARKGNSNGQTAGGDVEIADEDGQDDDKTVR